MKTRTRTKMLLLLGVLLFGFTVSAWSQKVSLNFNNEKVEKVLSSIKAQTGMGLVFSDQLIDVNRKISIQVKDASLDEALAKLLAGTKVTFEIKNNKIYFIEKKADQQSGSRKKKVSGVVKDATGEPIIGANVVEKGVGTNGVITNLDGEFTLEVPENASLIISYIGYLQQDVSTKGKDALNIIMKEDTKTLDEVVVVGYGVQKKVNLTGAVAAVDSKSLQNRPVTNVSNAIQGLLPGVTVISGTGQPGSDNTTIRVRGVGTLNNSNPMYMVDGLPVSSINEVDPSDIENISVLKDASSAAIYGSRAANGVILITTKKGGDKAPTLRYDGYVGWQKPTALPEYLHSWEYAKLYNKAMVNEGKNPIYTDEEIEKFRNGSDPDNYPDTDWQGLFYKTGLQHSHRAEISGGTDKMTYMFSAGYLGQDGIIDIAKYDRYSVRGNMNAKMGKFTAGMNLSFTYGEAQEPVSGFTGEMSNIFSQINQIAPFIPYKYSNGYYGYANDGNPLAFIEEGNLRTTKQHITRAIGNVSYEPIKGLKIQEIVGYEYKSISDEKFIKDIQYYNWKTGEPTKYQGPNNQTDERKNGLKLNLQTLVSYNNTFGKHTVGALAGYEQEYYREDWTKGYRKNFLNNDLWELNAGSPDGQTADGSANEYALRSFFGRLTYDYDNRYLVEANIRRDGTSRIFKDSRWGVFPSFSGAWRIINEPFMEGTRNVLSDLKLRGGWGVLGNQAISYYSYQSVLDQANYSFGGTVVQGVAPVDGANRDLIWETTETLNFGLDMGFLGNQYTLSIEGYRKLTYDILMKLPVSTLYGLNAPYQNAGKVKNTGLEITAGYKLNTHGWNFQVSANAAYNKNEVMDLKNGGARIWSGKYFNQEGYAINSIGGYIAEGLFKTEEEVANSATIPGTDTAPGDIKYRDINNDGKIDGEDRVYIGNTMPKWTFGLNLFAEWKGLDATFLFQGAADVQGYLAGPGVVGEMIGAKGKPSYMYRDCWDAETNPNGKFPRAFSSYRQNNSIYNPSSFWIVNSSYLRLKNFQLGYTLPKEWCNMMGISRIRVYYSGQNLLTFTKFDKGFDPESPEGGSSYPQVKTNTFGLNITF
ncbi:SusC/RagA family TonB-linked outer membrane protein [Bacteroides fragilis]|nr:SusC/RagA family TonB-linked outer membrane protein [Bacteroides fragilis]